MAQTRGSCAAGTASGVLDDGQVRARVFTNGNLFFGQGFNLGDQYMVPSTSNVSAIYAGGLWVSGRVGTELRSAGATYQNFAYRPGPLNADGSAPSPTNCSAYDRVFVVSAADIAAYNATGTATPDLAAWPVAWGAEVVDGDGVPGNYNLSGGDRPRLYGTQTAFWVMNDVATPPGSLGSTGAPIGLEVQVTAAAFGSSSPLAFQQATLYRYRLIKRSPGALEGTRVGLFLDPDLGDYTDDYVGTDVARSMAFTYNADNNDVGGYGLNPPAIGTTLLTGAGAVMYFINGVPPPQSDPFTPAGYDHILRGRWTDGTPMTEGGTGLGGGGAVTTFALSGDPVTGQFWSERNTNGSGAMATPGDRRYVVSSPDITLQPGVPYDFVVALPFGQGSNYLDSITQLRAASDAIQAAYNAGMLFPVDAESGAPTTAEAFALSTPRPNPTTGTSEVTLALAEASAVRVTVVDALGRVVAVAHDGALAAGAQRIALPSGLPAGVYAVVAETDGRRVTTRLSVVR